LYLNFDDKQTTVHFDGASTLNKQATRQVRYAKNRNIEIRIGKRLRNLILNPEEIVFENAKIRKLFRKVYRPGKKFYDSLIEHQGRCRFNIVIAPGEADISIAKMIHDNPTFKHCVVSKDSDFTMIHQASRITANLDKTGFIYFNQPFIQETLGISGDQLCLISISTGTDYNLQFFRKITSS